jgi:hypothetical protein
MNNADLTPAQKRDKYVQKMRRRVEARPQTRPMIDHARPILEAAMRKVTVRGRNRDRRVTAGEQVMEGLFANAMEGDMKALRALLKLGERYIDLDNRPPPDKLYRYVQITFDDIACWKRHGALPASCPDDPFDIAEEVLIRGWKRWQKYLENMEVPFTEADEIAPKP